jgi:endonuclease/exonuclease/phosphatase family metal-dependent hydrolase
MASCPTWPTRFSPLLIPIDHCLVSATVAVVKRSVGPNIGSGHCPLLVDLALTGD